MMAVGENGIRIFFTVPDVCENEKKGNAFDWSIPCTRGTGHQARSIANE
jgi:hypothetical protein